MESNMEMDIEYVEYEYNSKIYLVLNDIETAKITPTSFELAGKYSSLRGAKLQYNLCTDCGNYYNCKDNNKMPKGVFCDCKCNCNNPLNCTKCIVQKERRDKEFKALKKNVYTLEKRLFDYENAELLFEIQMQECISKLENLSI